MYASLFIYFIAALGVLNADQNCDSNYAFVMDESGSVLEKNYKASVDFVIDLVENNIAQSAQLMSLAFSTKRDYVWRFTDPQSPRGTETTPNTIIYELYEERADYDRGGTYTEAAMNRAIQDFEDNGFTQNNVIILITDGMPSDKPCGGLDVNGENALTQRLDASNIQVIIVGVGRFNPTNPAVLCLVRGQTADIINIDGFDFEPVISRLEATKIVCTCDENGIGQPCNSDTDCEQYGECMMCCKGTSECHKRPEFNPM